MGPLLVNSSNHNFCKYNQVYECPSISTLKERKNTKVKLDPESIDSRQNVPVST